MDHSFSPDVDPEQLAKSEALWNTFVTVSKWAVVAIAFGLIGMAIFLT